MARNEITTGIGLRHVRVALRDDDGTIQVPAAIAIGTAYPGLRISGAQALTLNVPDPQRVTARGDDRAYYTFNLPPTETPTGELRVSKTNGPVIAMVTGTKLFGSPVLRKKMGLATDRQGLESAVVMWGSRQGIDSEDGSVYFGQQIWQTYIILNALSTMRPATMEDATIGLVNFAVTANDATVDELGVLFTTDANGFTKSSYLLVITLNQFMIDAFLGDDSEDEFTLSQTPINAASLQVSLDGVMLVLTTDYTLSNDVLTMVLAPGDGSKIIVEYEYE